MANGRGGIVQSLCIFTCALSNGPGDPCRWGGGVGTEARLCPADPATWPCPAGNPGMITMTRPALAVRRARSPAAAALWLATRPAPPGRNDRGLVHSSSEYPPPLETRPAAAKQGVGVRFGKIFKISPGALRAPVLLIF
eukprot:gene23164-biopygen1239